MKEGGAPRPQAMAASTASLLRRSADGTKALRRTQSHPSKTMPLDARLTAVGRGRRNGLDTRDA